MKSRNSKNGLKFAELKNPNPTKSNKFLFLEICQNSKEIIEILEFQEICKVNENQDIKEIQETYEIIEKWKVNGIQELQE